MHANKITSLTFSAAPLEAISADVFARPNRIATPGAAGTERTQSNAAPPVEKQTRRDAGSCARFLQKKANLARALMKTLGLRGRAGEHAAGILEEPNAAVKPKQGV
jgi:hypothetical protein